MGAALTIALATTGCSHDVLTIDEAALPRDSVERPIGLTVAIVAGSFDRSRVKPAGIVDRFARKLREERVFQGVIYPIPTGANPTW